LLADLDAADVLPADAPSAFLYCITEFSGAFVTGALSDRSDARTQARQNFNRKLPPPSLHNLCYHYDREVCPSAVFHKYGNV